MKEEVLMYHNIEFIILILYKVWEQLLWEMVLQGDQLGKNYLNLPDKHKLNNPIKEALLIIIKHSNNTHNLLLEVIKKVLCSKTIVYQIWGLLKLINSLFTINNNSKLIQTNSHINLLITSNTTNHLQGLWDIK